MISLFISGIETNDDDHFIRFENKKAEEIEDIIVNDTLDKLQELEQNTREKHTLMFFFTGHGVIVDGDKYTSIVGNLKDTLFITLFKISLHSLYYYKFNFIRSEKLQNVLVIFCLVSKL